MGRATRIWREARGIFASFRIANTPEGDAALADALSPTGTRRRLSAEFHTAIRDGKAVPGTGRLWGAALVPAGAFPSAMVLAADTPTPDPATEPAATDPVTTSSTDVSEYTDENGVTWRRVAETETTTTATDTGTQTTSTTTVTEETTTEGEGDMPENTPTAVAASAVPPTQAPAATTQPRQPQLQEIFAAIATLRQNRRDAAAHAVLAALQPITTSGTNPLTSSGVVQPNWVGLIQQGVPYVREYIGLCNLGTDISLGGKKGFKVKRGTSGSPVTGNFDGAWSGDKSAINSYKGFTQTAASVLDKFAIGEDIAREFYDLPGGIEAVAGFLALIVEDHAVWSDTTALGYIVDTAGSPVAPATASYPDNYPAALGQVIQGILAVKKRKADGRRDVPSFAILNDLAYEELMYAAGGEQNLPAFINIAMQTSGQGTVDGGIQVVNGDVGIEDTAAALVGAKYAIDFDELAGGPLEIDALDIANGGIDKATHGYLQTFVKRPEALVLIGTADV